MLVDFHMHSVFSDGCLSPRELVAQGRLHGLGMMALTDHDEIAGIDSMIEAAGQDIKIIPGMELSSSYKGKDVHILGYDFDCQSPLLHSYLDYFKARRLERIQKMVDRCRENGYAISWADIQAIAPKTSAYGRPHIAQVLVQKGYAKNTNEAFDKILSSKGTCYVPKPKEAVDRVIDVIHDAGGYAVLAHPGLIKNDDYVKQILNFPIDGIEAYHTSHNFSQEDKYRSMAEQRGLFVTGGSDFHGIEGRYPSSIGEYTVESELVEEFISLVSCD